MNSLKRVVLFNLDSTNDYIYFRHYYIKKVPANINQNVLFNLKKIIKFSIFFKKIKKVLDTKKIPDLSKFNDISDFILKKKNVISEEKPKKAETEDAKTQYSLKLFVISMKFFFL